MNCILTQESSVYRSVRAETNAVALVAVVVRPRAVSALGLLRALFLLCEVSVRTWLPGGGGALESCVQRCCC